MSGLGKVILLQRDRRATEAMRLGFEREGAAVVAIDTIDDARTAISGEIGLIVAGADGDADAASVLGAIANATEGAGVDPPILYVGNGASRGRSVCSSCRSRKIAESTRSAGRTSTRGAGFWSE